MDHLLHYGVRGMKWGVRKATLREHWDSLKRERQWKKVLKDIDLLSTEQISAVAQRVKLENDLKTLSKKSKMATSHDKRAYIDRAKMTDEELSRTVTRLRAKDALARNISDASKEQRELGEKIVNVGGAIALKYATSNGSIGAKDIFDAVNSKNKPIKDRVVKELVDSVTKKANAT